MLRIGEGFAGTGAHSAHVSLLLAPNAILAGAFVLAAASPRPGHIPFQVVLKPNVPVKPPTLFIAKAVLRDAHHERLTWGPAQAGVAAGITRALLEDVFPEGAEAEWLAVALVWVDPAAEDLELLYANNQDATLLAAQRAMSDVAPSRADLRLALASVGNPYFTPLVS